MNPNPAIQEDTDMVNDIQPKALRKPMRKDLRKPLRAPSYRPAKPPVL